MVPPLITLEDHFLCKSMISHPRYSGQLKWVTEVSNKLSDVGGGRLQEMEKGKVTLQIVSHAPAQPDLKLAQEANAQLADAVKARPDRFQGFAMLPMGDPEAAANELEKCVKELGFVGALVDSHHKGKYYDGDEYKVLWKKFVELDVPIYLHPAFPSDQLAPYYAGNYPKTAEAAFGSSAFGWHSDVALHVLRLFAAGVFEEFPTLKVVIGHFGEMLPFMLERIAGMSDRFSNKTRAFQQVYDENVFITTSGVWSINPMACILRNTKIENILYSVDYPFENNVTGLAFMEELEKSGLVTQEQLEMIAYKNAEKLLKVKIAS